MTMWEPHPNCQYCAAVAAFESWVAEYDPEGELTLLEQIEQYAEEVKR